MRNWITSVNGERIYLKGINLLPAAPYLDLAGPALQRDDLERAKAAHLDLVRVTGHVAPADTYAAADELGLLVWQDLPMYGRLHRSARRHAATQARELVDSLGHHPSIALWCAHNPAPLSNPAPGSNHERTITTFVAGAETALRRQFPTINRTVLDRAAARALRRSDSTRPTIADRKSVV